MGNANESGTNKEEQKNSSQSKPKKTVLKKMKDPITSKIMATPTMVLTSMKIYDHTTITKWLKSGRSYDPLTGIPISIPQSPMTLVTRTDIKQKIDDFLDNNPQFKSLVLDPNDDSIKWELLFKHYDEQSQKKNAKLIEEQQSLKRKAKQLFKPVPFKMQSKSKEDGEENKENTENKENKENKKLSDNIGVEYDTSIVLQADIPVVCIMGPSRNGKSTIINDILGVENATEISTKSNVALTKGAWITKYSRKQDDAKQEGNVYQIINDSNDDNVEEKAREIKEFYLLDMEGLSHQVTKFTKRLFYACYAT
eukprot:483285_1